MPSSALKQLAASDFTIGFDRRDIPRLHTMWDQVLKSQRWAEGPFTEQFESLWSAQHDGLHAVATASWSAAALSTLSYFNVKNQVVLCPSNTFVATPLSVLKAGGRVEFVDCNRSDLCMSYDDFVRKAEQHKPVATWLVHIGGHIAFEVGKIADYCKTHNIILLEDCAHAHGAQWHGKKPGSWGEAGIYSFYATKTISTGEGGMLVTCNKGLTDFAKSFRNYGKPDYTIEGLNFKMSEFTAALGCLQAERLSEIVAWKQAFARNQLDPPYASRLRLPEGMQSGYYKYIVFEPIERSTGKVYDEPCHRIFKRDVVLPNTDWVARNHWCVPIYYTPDGSS